MKASLSERDRHTWALFEDWCTAHDQPALPAAPDSLARFLRAHPAAPATQRRRIAVIDAAHCRHALPPPGRGETVRAALDAARAARLRELAALLGGIIARLPESGWPSALFARRDALILTFVSTGLPYTQIAALRLCDVIVDPGSDALRVETANGTHAATSQELVRAGVSPKRVYRRWCEALGHHERYPSTGMLADAIEAVGGTELIGYDQHLDPAGEQPLLTPIDRWGHTPLASTPLTSRALADIVRMHLDGRAPAHPHPAVRVGRQNRKSHQSLRRRSCLTPATTNAEHVHADTLTTFSVTSIPPSPTSKSVRTDYWRIFSSSSSWRCRSVAEVVKVTSSFPQRICG